MAGKHRAARTHRAVKWTLGTVGLLLAVFYVIGVNTQQPATAAPAVPVVVATELPHCAQEDGSGSVLPCVWDGAVDGNGTGATVVYTQQPVCSVYEQAAAEQAAMHGYTLRLSCSNPTDGAN